MTERRPEKQISKKSWLKPVVNAFGRSLEVLVTGGWGVTQRHNDFLERRYGVPRSKKTF